MTEALDIDPEDCLYLTQDIERIFDIKLTDQETERCISFGDLYDTVAAHNPKLWNNVAGPCASMFVFNRLRRFSGMPRVMFRPDTPLASLMEHAPRGLWRRLHAGTGLKLPSPVLSYGQLVLGLVPLGLFLTLAPGQIALAMGAACVAGLALYSLDPKPAAPHDLATVGDLVDRVAALNADSLARAGVRPPSLWATLSGLVLDVAGRSSVRLDRSTLLLRP